MNELMTLILHQEHLKIYKVPQFPVTWNYFIRIHHPFTSTKLSITLG